MIKCMNHNHMVMASGVLLIHKEYREEGRFDDMDFVSYDRKWCFFDKFYMGWRKHFVKNDIPRLDISNLGIIIVIVS